MFLLVPWVDWMNGLNKLLFEGCIYLTVNFLLTCFDYLLLLAIVTEILIVHLVLGLIILFLLIFVDFFLILINFLVHLDSRIFQVEFYRILLLDLVVHFYKNISFEAWFKVDLFHFLEIHLVSVQEEIN